MGLGARIKKCREVKGMSQAGLAECMGQKNASIIGNWELGNSRPDADKLCKLCDVLGVSADYLLGRIPEDTTIAGEANELTRRYLAMDGRGQAVVKAIVDLEYEHCNKGAAMADLEAEAENGERYQMTEKFITRSHPQYHEMVQEVDRIKELRKARGASMEGILYFAWSARPTSRICLADIIAVFHRVRVPSPEFGRLIRAYLEDRYNVDVF